MHWYGHGGISYALATMSVNLYVHLKSGESELAVAPWRGGLPTSWRIDDREVFFMDEATFADTSRSVRGGSPLLFPSPGRLQNDTFVTEHARGRLRQHGFAREMAWTLGDGGRFHAESNADTLALYPWSWKLSMRPRLAGQHLLLEHGVTNTSQHMMPFAFGHHPYFYVPLERKSALRVHTKATRAWHNVAKSFGPPGALDFGAGELDVVLYDHPSQEFVLSDDDGPLLRVSASHEYSTWVLWTLPGKPFVCVEPWTAPPDALNSGQKLLWLEPGETRDMWVQYQSLRAL